jgi:hypothetical protein
MAEKKGTFAFQFLVDRKWPPRCQTSLIRCSGETLFGVRSRAVVDLEIHPDGHLSLTIDDPDEGSSQITEFERIHVAGEGWLRLVAVISSHRSTSVFIEGVSLGPYVLDEAPREFVPSPNGRIVFPLRHPGADQACKPWIDNRRKKFGGTAINKGPGKKPGRRPQSLHEQAQSLYNASERLKSLSAEIRHTGSDDKLGPLVGELRGLLYWVKDDKPDANYNPLLLRLASRVDVPLPVLDQDTSRLQGADVLIDFQEFLTQPAAVHNIPAGESGGAAPSKLIMSKKTLIAEAANTLGTSHYDEDVPEAFTPMRSVKAIGVDVLSTSLCGIASFAIEFAEMVLRELDQQKLVKLSEIKRTAPR